MRITYRPSLPNIRQMIRFGAVVPRRRRRIFHPGVIRAGVIRYLILNDFDSELMRSINQLAELRQAAEMLFNPVEIDSTIAVIVRDLSFLLAWTIARTAQMFAFAAVAAASVALGAASERRP